MEDIYERNMAQLKLWNDALYKGVKDYEKSWNEAVALSEMAKNGERILCYIADDKLHYLNSKYNPTKEAEKFMADSVDIKEQCFITMYGFANGDFVREFLDKSNPNTGCLIYEPSADVFMRALHDIDITDIMVSGRVYLAVEGINAGHFGMWLQTYFSAMNAEKNKYIFLPIYAKLFPRFLEKYQSIITDKYTNYVLQTNTIVGDGKKFAYTSIQNMRYLPGCRSDKHCIDAFPKDFPVIIVSAGPSLEKNVSLLNEVNGRAFVLVVDSAIRTVLKRGIRPDAFITVDPNKELKNFEAEGVDDVLWLADMSVNTDALDMVKPRDLMFYTSHFPVWHRMFREQGAEIGNLLSGGSVALAAMNLMIKWGFKKIIMIGQDLALTNGQQYADGVKLTGNENFKYNIMTIKDIYGNDILTKADYYVFIKDIEDLVYANPDVEFIDATEGGAYKKNTKIMTLKEAIDRYCIESFDVQGLLLSGDRLFEDKNIVIDTLENMRINIRDIEKPLKDTAADCAKAANELRSKSVNKRELQEINARMSVLDDRLCDMEERVLFQQVAAKADKDFDAEVYDRKEDSIDEAIRLYTNSARFYEGMSEAVPVIIGMIDECLGKIR